MEILPMDFQNLNKAKRINVVIFLKYISRDDSEQSQVTSMAF